MKKNILVLFVLIILVPNYSHAQEYGHFEKKIQWIKSNAIPIKSVIAENGFEDLQPLKEILKNVNYVGLGEATHGTREFFLMKHRLLEFLVLELGFSVLAIEASISGCKRINDYILNGKGDLYKVLENQGFWVWDTYEVIQMIEWMRRFNKSASEDKKIRFVGIDVQIDKLGGGVESIEKYLQKVDTIRFSEMKDVLRNINVPSDAMTKDSILSSYKDFLSFFVMSKGLYIQKSSEKEYEKTLDLIRSLLQFSDSYMLTKQDVRYRKRNWRDYYMASNFFDMLKNEKPGTKVVIWAHNGHISHNTASNSGKAMQRPLGNYLKNAFGDQYYSFGFGFSHGSFNAIEYGESRKNKGLQKFIVKPAKKESIDWYFAQTKIPVFILNLRDDNIPQYMTDLLSKPHDKREFGSVAWRTALHRSYFKLALKSTYDGIIFINETSHTNPTPTGIKMEE